MRIITHSNLTKHYPRKDITMINKNDLYNAVDLLSENLSKQNNNPTYNTGYLRALINVLELADKLDK